MKLDKGKVVYLLALGLILLVFYLMFSVTLNGWLVSISASAIGSDGEEIIESYSSSEESELKIKEAPKAAGGKVPKNKNTRIDLNVEGKNTKLYFDLLDYNKFKQEIIENKNKERTLAAANNSERKVLFLGSELSTDSLDDTISIETVDKEEIESALDELSDDKIENITGQITEDLKDFDIDVDEQAGNKDYKWGYGVRLEHHDLLAKIKVTSEDSIEIYNSDTLKIGNSLLSFNDLVQEGYTISFDKPIIYDDLVANETDDPLDYHPEGCEANYSNSSLIETNSTDSLNETTNSTDFPDEISNYTGDEPEDLPVNETIEETEVNQSLENEENNRASSGEVETPVTDADIVEDDNLVVEADDSGNSAENSEEPPVEEANAEETENGAILENIFAIVIGFFYSFLNLDDSIISGCAVDGASDEEYANSLDIYVQKDFSGTGHQIGDLIYLDPTLVIIKISKANHLGQNREYLSDVYEGVKELDGTYSEQINDGEYVRVTFERNLTNENDITVYARIANYSSGMSSSLEVYEKDSDYLLATFEGFNGLPNEKKIYLTNITGEQDIFDLKVLGDSLEFDHIIDPSANNSNNIVYRCGTIDSPGVYTLNQSLYVSAASCIGITKSNVTLDCNGYTIRGDMQYEFGEDSTNGIYSQLNTPLKNITITNCKISNFTSGLSFTYVNDSIITNTNVSSPTSPDIIFYCHGCSRLNITNNYVDAVSSFSSSTNSSFSNNSFYAQITLSTQSHNNTFFNNLFRATYPYVSYSTSPVVNFNTTYSCSSGLNIKNGACFGGNYYTNSSNTGFSDTCADTDRNDICDSRYNYTTTGGVGTDYLPLATPKSPLISIVYPVNATTYALPISELNYTVTDINPNKCWYTLDSGITNSSSVTCGTNFTNVNFTAGSNTVKLYANDTSGALNSTQITFTIRSAPTVSGLWISGGNNTRENITCTYNIGDTDNAVVNVSGSWYKEGIVNFSFTNNNISRDTNYSNVLLEGNTTKADKWSCFIMPSDNDGNGTSSISANITVGNAIPFIGSLQISTGIYHIHTPNVSLTYYDYDLESGTIYYKWYLNGSNVENDTITGVANGTTSRAYLNATIRGGDLINASIIVGDGESNSTGNSTSLVTVKEGPRITSLNSPANDSWKNTSSIVFAFTPRFMEANITACSLYGNWSGWGIKGTILDPPNATESSFEPISIGSGGMYKWNILCEDGSVNGTMASSNSTFHIDLMAPNVTILSGMPANNSVGGAAAIINWSATDDMSNNITCYPYYSGSYENTTSANYMSNGSGKSVSLTLAGGNHNLGARCYDEANNSALSSTISYLVAVINFSNPLDGQTFRYGQTTNLTVEELEGLDFLNNATILIDGATDETVYLLGDPIHSILHTWNLSPAYVNLTATAFNRSVGSSRNVTQTINITLLRAEGNTTLPSINNACPNETYATNGSNVLISLISDMDTLLLRENVTVTAPNSAKYRLTPSSLLKDGYNNYNVSANYSFAVNQTGNYLIQATITDMENQSSNWNYTFYSSSGYQNYQINSSTITNISLIDKCDEELSGSEDGLILTLPTMHLLDLDVSIDDTLHDIDLTIRNVNLSATGNLTEAVSYNELSSEINASSGYRRVALFELNSSFNLTNYTIVYNYTPIAHTINDESTLRMEKCESLTSCSLTDTNAVVETSANTITATLTDFSYFLISESAATVETVTTTTSGGGSTTTKVVGVNFIVPSDIELELKDQIVVPLIIVNPTNSKLTGIKLSAQSNTPDIDAVLEKTTLDSLEAYKNDTLMLFLESHSTPGDYEVKIDAAVKSPAFTDSTVIYVKLTESIGKKEVVERVVLAQDLFRENPQCLELNDFLIEAQRLLDEGSVEEARQIVQETIYRCKELVTDKSLISNLEVVKEWRTPIIVVLILLVIALIVALTIIRPRLNIYKPRKNKASIFKVRRKGGRRKNISDIYNQ